MHACVYPGMKTLKITLALIHLQEVDISAVKKDPFMDDM